MPSTAPKLMVAALLAGMLALTMAPARSAETSTPDDTARFLAGLPPAAGSPARIARQESILGAARAPFRFHFRTGGQDQTLGNSRIFPGTAARKASDDAVYVQRSGFPLCRFVFSERPDLRAERPLQPVGEVPQLTGLTHPAVDLSLHNLEVLLSSLLSISFFITKNMQTQLEGGPVYGTLPVLYVFLARTGKTIHDVSFVSLDTAGNIETAPVRRKRGQEICPKRGQRREDRLFGRQRAQSDALLFQHQSCRRRSRKRAASCNSATGSASPTVSLRARLSDLQRRLQQGAQFHSQPQRDDRAGRHRHSAYLFRSEKMAAATVRSLSRSDFRIFLVLPARDGGCLKGQAHPDRFRARLPVANGRIEPAGRAEDRARRRFRY